MKAIGLMAVLTLLAGCSSDHSGSGMEPSTSTDPLGEGNAVVIGTSTIALVSDLIVLLPEWVDGNLGGIGGTREPGSVLGSTDPTWSDRDKAWVFSDSLVRGGLPTVTHYGYQYFAQYLRCDDWQREARGADEMNLRIVLQESGHGESEPDAAMGYTYDYRYRYTVFGGTDRLREPTHRYRANGGMDGEYTLVSSSGVNHYEYQATYDVDIQWSEGTCATGRVTVTVDPYTVIGTYDGDETISWVLKQTIHTRRTGTLTYDCR